MTPKFDSIAVADIIAETAATEIVPRFRALAEHEVEEKSPGELVTVADHRSEEVLTRRLADHLPGSVVVGEEAVARDPATLAVLGDDDPVWIVDPLDGTSNFAHGRPAFAVIVALVQSARILAGWIHDPNKAVTATVEIGAGAWLGDTKMAVSEAQDIAAMRAILTAKYFSGALREGVERLRQRVGTVTPFSCAGLASVEICSGEAEIATPKRLRPWDHAAGALMHREAGGHNAMVDGAPYSPLVDRGLFIVAPDAAVWREVRRLMTGDES